MSAESAQLLAATLSWMDGLASVVLLGLLLPLGLALTTATVVFGVQRGDWRLVPGAFLSALLFGGVGTIALLIVSPPAPGRDYWLGLSGAIGGVVLIAALMTVAEQAVRRRRENRIRHEAIRSPQVVDHEGELLPHPGRRLHLNAVSAEHYVAEWMRHLGAIDAVVTPFRRDGGVDVRSSRYVAQVKHRSDLVPVSAVRELIGVAGLEGRQALFFTTGAYSRDALALASRGGVALFIVRHHEGRLVPANALASSLMSSGLSRAEAPVYLGAAEALSRPT